MWLFRLVTWANERPQLASIHTNGLSPVCSLVWLFKLVTCVNAFPHSLHTYGLSFRWIRSWFRRFAACVNPFWQYEQMNLRSIEWFLICDRRDDFRENVLAQSPHVPSSPCNSLSPFCSDFSSSSARPIASCLMLIGASWDDVDDWESVFKFMSVARDKFVGWFVEDAFSWTVTGTVALFICWLVIVAVTGCCWRVW